MNFDIFRAARGLNFSLPAQSLLERRARGVSAERIRAAMRDLAGRRRGRESEDSRRRGLSWLQLVASRRRGPGAFRLNQGKMAVCHFLAANRETFRAARVRQLSTTSTSGSSANSPSTWVAPPASFGLDLLRCGGHCADKFPSRVVSGLPLLIQAIAVVVGTRGRANKYRHMSDRWR